MVCYSLVAAGISVLILSSVKFDSTTSTRMWDMNLQCLGKMHQTMQFTAVPPLRIDMDRVSAGDPNLPGECRQSEDHQNLSDWTNWLQRESKGEGLGMAEIASYKKSREITRSDKKGQLYVEHCHC